VSVRGGEDSGFSTGSAQTQQKERKDVAKSLVEIELDAPDRSCSL
jgi:hypothetical protein